MAATRCINTWVCFDARFRPTDFSKWLSVISEVIIGDEHNGFRKQAAFRRFQDFAPLFTETASFLASRRQKLHTIPAFCESRKRRRNGAANVYE